MYPYRPVFEPGTFIEPEHFHELINYIDRLVAPGTFGVARLVLDEDALRHHTIAFTEFAGVLPSGERLRVGPGSGVTLPQLRFDTQARSNAASLSVWLGLPCVREGAANCQADPHGVSPYAAVPRDTVDWVGGKHRATLTVAVPRPQIRLGSEADGDFDGLCVARLRRDGAARYVLDDGYLPPLLHLGAAPRLADRLGALVHQMAVRGDELTQHWQLCGGKSATLTTTDVALTMFRAALELHLPTLRVLRNHGELFRPIDGYRELARCAGHLAALTRGERSSDIAAYDPNDLGGALFSLVAQIEEIVRAELYRNYVCLAFEPPDEQRTTYKADIAGLRGKSAQDYFLRVHFSNAAGHVVNDQNALLQRVFAGVKLGSAEVVAEATLMAGAGAQLLPTNAIPQGLPVHPGCGYLKFAANDLRFVRALTGGALHLHLTSGVLASSQLQPHFALIALTG